MPPQRTAVRNARIESRARREFRSHRAQRPRNAKLLPEAASHCAARPSRPSSLVPEVAEAAAVCADRTRRPPRNVAEATLLCRALSAGGEAAPHHGSVAEGRRLGRSSISGPPAASRAGGTKERYSRWSPARELEPPRTLLWTAGSYCGGGA